MAKVLFSSLKWCMCQKKKKPSFKAKKYLVLKIQRETPFRITIEKSKRSILVLFFWHVCHLSMKIRSLKHENKIFLVLVILVFFLYFGNGELDRIFFQSHITCFNKKIPYIFKPNQVENFIDLQMKSPLSLFKNLFTFEC